jgi:hypothetical protein
MVRTNHFCLNIDETLKIQEYSVTISRAAKQDEVKDQKEEDTTNQDPPREVAKRIRREIIKQLLVMLRADAVKAKKPRQGDFISDFANKLYLANDAAEFDMSQVRIITVWRKSYEVAVKHVNEHDLATLFGYLRTSGTFDSSRKHEALLALNIWLHHNSKNNQRKVVAGSKTFDILPPSTDTCDLYGGLTAMRGIFATIRPATGRVLANIQVAHSPFITPGPLKTLIDDPEVDMDRLDRLVRLLRVEAIHLEKAGQKSYKTILRFAKARDADPNTLRITRDHADARSVEFRFDPRNPNRETEDDLTPRWRTVADYFQKRYNVTCTPGYPLLDVGTLAKPVYMPMDVLVIAEGQPARVDLMPKQMTAMLKFADGGPADNLPHVRRGPRLLDQQFDSDTARPAGPAPFAPSKRISRSSPRGSWIVYKSNTRK